MIFDIAILIPHYNNLVGLNQTLRSIQANRSVIVVIVDDGSAQPLKKKNLECDISDIVILHNNVNLGIEQTLNKGLLYIKKELKVSYIARIDCGDIMVNDRLDKQSSFLDNEESNFGLVGSWVEFFEQDKVVFRLKLPTQHEQIRKMMMLGVCFIHPAVMFKTSLIDKIGLYPLDYPAAEDYAYFIMALQHVKTSNIPEVLTRVESNSRGISITKRRVQLRSKLRIISEYRTHTIYYIVGVIKILLLSFIPYSIILTLKRSLYK